MQRGFLPHELNSSLCGGLAFCSNDKTFMSNTRTVSVTSINEYCEENHEYLTNSCPGNLISERSMIEYQEITALVELIESFFM